eukprot:Skav212247  [mRNA]  locus=scaffold999:27196:39716:- [translate_table: standard]
MRSDVMRSLLAHSSVELLLQGEDPYAAMATAQEEAAAEKDELDVKDEGGVKMESFEPATSFMGARPGWCFKMGMRGLGYYRDPKQDMGVKGEVKEEKKAKVKEEDEKNLSTKSWFHRDLGDLVIVAALLLALLSAPMRASAPKRVPRRVAPRLSSQRSSVTRAATKVVNPRPGRAASTSARAAAVTFLFAVSCEKSVVV